MELLVVRGSLLQFRDKKADVQKPSLSVGARTALGHEVIFGKTGGVITHVRSKR